MKIKLTLLTILLLLLIVPTALASSSLEATNIANKINDDCSVTTTFKVKNVGDAPFYGKVLLEVQPQKKSSALSIVVSGQKTCDASYPNNVNKVLTVDPSTPLGVGASTDTITLKTGSLATGDYNIIGVSTDSCCTDNVNCVALNPFKWNTYLGTAKIPTSCKPSSAVTCGDKMCNGGENALTCINDCKAYLGDGVCSAGESYPDEPACKSTVQDTTSAATGNFSSGVIWIIGIVGIVGLFYWMNKKKK